MTLEEVEANLQTVSDSLKNLDDLVRGRTELVFRCSHSGLFWPADYARLWGIKYGIGLGTRVGSECFDTLYNIAPTITDKLRHVNQITHPVRHSMADLDAFFLHPSEINGKYLIASADDRFGERRGKIIRENQRKNPRGRILTAIMLAQKLGIFLEGVDDHATTID